jgi:hypothetical protein
MAMSVDMAVVMTHPIPWMRIGTMISVMLALLVVMVRNGATNDGSCNHSTPVFVPRFRIANIECCHYGNRNSQNQQGLEKEI